MGSLKTKRAVASDHHNGELDAWKTLLFVMYFPLTHTQAPPPLLPELLLFSLPCYCSTGAASTHACQVNQLILQNSMPKIKSIP